MDYRADRMKTWIIQAFTDCLEQEDFSLITVGKIAETAQINRSTFYRYFEDKYALRDCIVDDLIQDFAEHMEVDFLYVDIKDNDSHSRELEENLARLHAHKRILEILWTQKLLGRNVFEEMMDAGSAKVEQAILNHPDIQANRKEYADWYAKLLVNNFLVTVRWWFTRGDSVSAQQVTHMMKRHMISGAIPTLCRGILDAD